MKYFLLVATSAVIVMASAARAETQQERQACESDAFKVCGSFIPDRDKVFACMVSKKNQLSAPCQKVMAQYSQTNRHGHTEEAASHSETTGQGGQSD
jgi:opacity protein-like surface antigen